MSNWKIRPLVFGTSIHETLWGRESWEISAHPSDPSTLALGELFPGFPLLFKVIDAKTRLSVQVHPNETTCKVTGGDPKTEMWCALSAGPIYAGLKPGTTSAAIAAAVESGRFEELLVRHEARPGDVFFIPGGLVHAIGDNVRLYEVQQSSNTTFRLYDWGRVGADGKPRVLHVEKALQAIDYTLPVPAACNALKTPFFDFAQQDLAGETAFETAGDEYLAVYTAKGGVTLDGRDIAEGTSVLVPPGTACRATATDAHLLVTRFKA